MSVRSKRRRRWRRQAERALAAGLRRIYDTFSANVQIDKAEGNALDAIGELYGVSR